MKRTLHTILITTILLTLLFTSCNADASAGLFRQLADAKAPVGITYRQIIGVDPAAPTTLFFLLDDGIYSKQDGTSSQLLLKATKPIRKASLDTATNTITYMTNKDADAKGGIDIWQVGTDGNGNSKMPDPSYGGITISGFRQLPNGKFVVQGLKAGTHTFSVVSYGANAFTEEVSKDDLDGYSFHSELLLSGKNSLDLSATTPVILSLSKDSNYVHYYYDTSGSKTFYKITLPKATEQIAAFSLVTPKLYILTTDGVLYSSAVPGADISVNTVEYTSSNKYSINSFMYSVTNAGTTHIIAKPNLKSNTTIGFEVFTDNGTTTTSTPITQGYARKMNDITIVNAYEKSPGKLLIATEKNGMFDISITADYANKNDSSNGSSSEAEKYSVI